ncbi:MAG: putative D,D-dipeptide transport ATP-binding protein DdpD [Holophagaceae bacterium]|nr:putative D,D-dipeptide transport ATP-binding protein DdpD [Holophagaceae bacterium]
MDFALEAGTALGVVGQSGVGKSTLLNLVLGLLEPTEGRILLEGEAWSPLAEPARRLRRPRLQAVFQNALASLPPHRTGWEILQEPLDVWRRGDFASRRDAAARMAARVAFPEAALDQRPAAWSGGLGQRLCLGRALMLEPALVVLDEPFSALDATLAGHLLGVLQRVKAEGTALLIATHDLALARILCDHLLLLGQGEVLWQGRTDGAPPTPEHPHLRALREAAPQLPAG